MEPLQPGYGMYIKRLSDCLSKEVNRVLEQHNLTMSQSHLLMALYHREGNSASLKELESLFGVAQSTMAGIAARMENKGFLVSCPDPADRRIKHVRLTEEGRAVCQASHAAAMDTEAQLTAALTDIERQVFISLLEKVYQAVK